MNRNNINSVVPKSIQPPRMDPGSQKPFAMNHLFVGKNMTDKKSRSRRSSSGSDYNSYNGTVTPATPSTLASKISVCPTALQNERSSSRWVSCETSIPSVNTCPIFKSRTS